MIMGADFTSIVLDHGLVPIAPTIRKRLGLRSGDQVRIRIDVLHRPQRRTSPARYAALLAEKDARVLTLKEQAELIALANGELDLSIARAQKIVQKHHPELFDKRGNLNRSRALTLLSSPAGKIKTLTKNGSKSRQSAT